MSKSKKKNKKKTQHAKTTIKTNTTQGPVKMVNKLEQMSQNIGIKNKYSERIKTSYICLFLYLGLWSIAMNLAKTDPTTSASLLVTGALACIFNIIKAIMSIRDNEKVTHNIVIIVIHSLFIFIFLGWMFV